MLERVVRLVIRRLNCMSYKHIGNILVSSKRCQTQFRKGSFADLREYYIYNFFKPSNAKIITLTISVKLITQNRSYGAGRIYGVKRQKFFTHLIECPLAMISISSRSQCGSISMSKDSPRLKIRR